MNGRRLCFIVGLFSLFTLNPASGAQSAETAAVHQNEASALLDGAVSLARQNQGITAVDDIEDSRLSNILRNNLQIGRSARTGRVAGKILTCCAGAERTFQINMISIKYDRGAGFDRDVKSLKAMDGYFKNTEILTFFEFRQKPDLILILFTEQSGSMRAMSFIHRFP